MSVIAEKNKDRQPNYIRGLKIKYNSVSSILILPGECRDDGDSKDIESTSNITVSITTTGAGGLDTGSEASNTWYAVHIIKGTSGVSGLFSLSSTSPTMPSGYTFSKFIGWVRNDSSSNIIKFVMNGSKNMRRVIYTNETIDRAVVSSGAATVWTDINCSAFVPEGVRLIEIREVSRVREKTFELHVRENGQTTTGFIWIPRLDYVSGTTHLNPQIKIGVDVDRKIEYKLVRVTANTFIQISDYYLEL